MKKISSIFITSMLLVSISAIGQMRQKIGTNATIIEASATLELESKNTGFLPPRMKQADRNTIVSPVATGLIIYCTNCGTNGELEVYNGTTWTNIVGGTASTPYPGAPTNPVATALYGKATVSFTVPASGYSAITGYTVTSFPGNISVTGLSSPLTVTGLTNGISYTFTVVATNAEGNSSASLSSNAVIPNCGAYVSAEVYKIFECFNLGATNTTVDPNTPIQSIHGNYYQWGSNTIRANDSTPSAAISWNTNAAVNNAWVDASKTTNDPCPAGFRVPTKTQWDGVLANNTLTRTGSWSNNPTNFSAALHFVPNASTTKTLTLPATGYRDYNDGTLSSRGTNGFYWSSTETGSYAWYFNFTSSGASTNFDDRTYGLSVRCVSE